ncbi:MAG: hypothetical protein IPN05_01355 [Sulfuritalea sp.]|nr:hypothetical protein [Sulfuritalea sp.]
MEGHLYVVWPVGAKEIAAVINQDKMPGSHDAQQHFDMLVERNQPISGNDKVMAIVAG